VKQSDGDRDYPMRLNTTIPLHLYEQFIEAIGHRAMHLVGEYKQNKVIGAVSQADLKAMKQAKQEAIQEAIEDWLAKEKDEKWLSS
jgi:hypothetical protein